MEPSRQEGERGQPLGRDDVERDRHAVVERDFAKLLVRAGLHAALGLLNGRVRYRYSGVYRFDPPVLRNVGLYDRENPEVIFSRTELVLTESYCGIVQTTVRPFVTEDATADERLAGFSAREWMLSYLGVPLRANGGALLGTLCHWDGRPRLAPDGEVRLLQRLAPTLASWLARSGTAD